MNFRLAQPQVLIDLNRLSELSYIHANGSEGLRIGAMTRQREVERSATVKAQTKCSVVKVPKEQFTDLIKSNPSTIHSLLIDMANSIVNLNEQLVGLSSKLRE